MSVGKFFILCVLGIFAAPVGAIGFQHAIVADAEDRPIEIGIWYPSETASASPKNTDWFGQSLAIDATIIADEIPVIVLSHGHGGWMGSHADTAYALAKAGYIAIAPTHTGVNYRDTSYPPSRWMLDRQRHLDLVLDFVVDTWEYHNQVDASRIGIYGFSAGGFTALVASGGQPDLARLLDYCRQNRDEFVCKVGVAHDTELKKLTAQQSFLWKKNARIKAAIIAAPGFGFAFDKQALDKVNIPIQLWSGSEDKSVPYASNIKHLVQNLPESTEFHHVDGASHFSFLRPCNPVLEKSNPGLWAEICVDKHDFDRQKFHRTLNARIISFFDQVLKRQPK